MPLVFGAAGIGEMSAAEARSLAIELCSLGVALAAAYLLFAGAVWAACQRGPRRVGMAAQFLLCLALLPGAALGGLSAFRLGAALGTPAAAERFGPAALVGGSLTFLAFGLAALRVIGGLFRWLGITFSGGGPGRGPAV